MFTSMSTSYLETVLHYIWHGSSRWYTVFVWKDLMDKTSMVRIVVLPRSNGCNLPVLWLIPEGLIPQEVCLPKLIYKYKWSVLNKSVLRQAHEDTMQCGLALQWLFCYILQENQHWEPVFTSKVDLDNTYMRIWVRPEEIPCLYFPIAPHAFDQETIIIFVNICKWEMSTSLKISAAGAILSPIWSMPDGTPLMVHMVPSRHHLVQPPSCRKWRGIQTPILGPSIIILPTFSP